MIEPAGRPALTSSNLSRNDRLHTPVNWFSIADDGEMHCAGRSGAATGRWPTAHRWRSRFVSIGSREMDDGGG